MPVCTDRATTCSRYPSALQADQGISVHARNIQQARCTSTTYNSARFDSHCHKLPRTLCLQCSFFVQQFVSAVAESGTWGGNRDSRGGEAHLWAQRAVVCLWVVWVVVLVDIKVVCMLLAQSDCHVLVVIWVISRHPTGGNNNIATI